MGGGDSIIYQLTYSILQQLSRIKLETSIILLNNFFFVTSRGYPVILYFLVYEMETSFESCVNPFSLTRYVPTSNILLNIDCELADEKQCLGFLRTDNQTFHVTFRKMFLTL